MASHPHSKAVDRLVRATNWSGRSYVSTAWRDVEQELGLALPAEYKELLAVFPPGKFIAPLGADGRVIVHPPRHLDYLRQFRTELRELREWRAEHPAEVPRPVFPEPGGMLPWGRADRECLLWVCDSADPDEWTVAVSNGGTWRYRYDENLLVVEEFDCGAVDFLIGLVTGEIKSQVLNPVGFLERAAGKPEPDQTRAVQAFLPLPEDEWRASVRRG